MAARDERRQNNRAKVNTTQTKTRQRLIEGKDTTQDHTVYYAARQDGRGTYGWSDTSQNSWERNGNNPEFYRQGGGNSFSNTDQWGSTQGQVVSVSGPTYFSRGSSEYMKGYTGKATVTTKKQGQDRRVSESYSVNSSRMQALDKRSGDDDAQARRGLKTKREGRNKLRIQLSGDASGGRLKGGPNKDRKGNKLKIDVQGGGKSGLNVPR